MRRIISLGLSICLLAGCHQEPEGEAIARAEIGPGATQVDAEKAGPAEPENIASQVESACRSVIFEDTSLTHCLALPSRHAITTDLAPAAGDSGASLSSFSETLEAERIAFVVNAGEIDEQSQPVGYFVKGSDRLSELETGAGEGDFFLAPNGVFFGTGGEWEIRSTEDFLANVTERPEWGTQSGPMLVIAGKLHPRIKHDGATRLVRNAVGLDDKGRAHFVISNAPISLGKLARFYRDELGAENALMLEAETSVLWNPATGRMDSGTALGPLIVVTRKETAAE